MLQYTGGTTGVPKGAMLTHYNIFANVVQTQCWAHTRHCGAAKTRYLLVIPFFHIYGFTVGMMAGVWRGAQQVLIPKYDVEMLLDAIRDYRRPTSRPSRPSTSRCSITRRRRSTASTGYAHFNSGSAPLPVEVIEQFERLTGGTLKEGYGLSEASPVTHTTPALVAPQAGQHRPAAARHGHQDR